MSSGRALPARAADVAKVPHADHESKIKLVPPAFGCPGFANGTGIEILAAI